MATVCKHCNTGVLSGQAVIRPDFDNEIGEDYIVDAEGSFWLTIKGLSLYIQPHERGLTVEILPASLGGEAFLPAFDVATARWPEED